MQIKARLYEYLDEITCYGIQETFVESQEDPLPASTIKAGKAFCYAL